MLGYDYFRGNFTEIDKVLIYKASSNNIYLYWL